MSRLFNRFVLVLAAIVAIFAFIGISAVNNAEAGGGPYVTIDLPQQATVGRQPITLTIKVVNASSQKQAFTGLVWHGGLGWSGGDNGYTLDRGEVFGFEADSTGAYHYWRGDVLPNSTATLQIPTFTGNIIGTFDFARASFIITGSHTVSGAAKQLIVVKATPTATATPKPRPTATATPTPRPVVSASLRAQNSVWPRGGQQTMNLDVKSNLKISWLSIQSTCPPGSLSSYDPVGGPSNPNSNEVHRIASFRVENDAKKGKCSFALNVTLIDSTTVSFAGPSVIIK